MSVFLVIDIAFIRGEMWDRGSACGVFSRRYWGGEGGCFVFLESTSTVFVQIDALNYETFHSSVRQEGAVKGRRIHYKYTITSRALIS